MWYIWGEGGRQKQGDRVSNAVLKHLLCHTSPYVDGQGLKESWDHFLSQSPMFIDKEFEAQYIHALLSLAQFFLFKRKVWPLFKVVSECKKHRKGAGFHSVRQA